MSLHAFDTATLPVTPWKNGGGSTREIACWPPGAGLGDFEWRLSIATIAAGGPFSVFPGIDRTIMLLAGDGVRLHSADGTLDHRLDTPHRPCAFSGDLALDCTLLGSASSDFNVMARRGRWHAKVQVLESAAPLAGASHGMLLALCGRWQLDGMSTIDCAEGEGLWWADAPHAWHATPDGADARLLAVRFDPAAA
ncbi:HutD family protein [Variovorax paradoxus]|nr:HutD family protein [Variovorax paradoxus]